MSRLRPWIAIIVVVTASLARAQTTQTSFDPVLQNLIATIERTVASENIDVNTDNIDALKPYLAPEFSAVMATGRQIHNPDELRLFGKDAKSSYIGPGGKYRLQVIHEPAVVIGDAATAKGTTEETIVTSNGREHHYHSTWTAVFRRNSALAPDAPGHWQLVRLHVSVDPLFNSFAVHFRNVIGRWFAIGGILIGVAIGFALSWFNRWRKTRPRTAR
jgi:hypothetical protein